MVKRPKDRSRCPRRAVQATRRRPRRRQRRLPPKTHRTSVLHSRLTSQQRRFASGRPMLKVLTVPCDGPPFTRYSRSSRVDPRRPTARQDCWRPAATKRTTPAIRHIPPAIGGSGRDWVLSCVTCSGPRSTTFSLVVHVTPP